MEAIETKRLIRATSPDATTERRCTSTRPNPKAVTTCRGPNSAIKTIDFVRKAIEDAGRPNRKTFELAKRPLREEGTAHRSTGSGGLATENRDAGNGVHREPRLLKRGYASEAAAAMVEFGFRQQGLHRNLGDVRPGQSASARVPREDRNDREGRLRQNQWRKGDWRDSLLYSILYPEWKLAREATA